MPHGADASLMVDAVGEFPPGLSVDTLLKGNKVISGHLILEETSRCWLPLEGETISHSFPFRLQDTLVQRPGMGLTASFNVWTCDVTNVKVTCRINEGGVQILR